MLNLQFACPVSIAQEQLSSCEESLAGDNFGILEDLHDDVSSALAELQHVKERRSDTLSFKELLANCDALYKLIEDGIRKLELQLQQYGYTPVETPKYIHREAVEYPSHQKIETDSQNPFEAISPPRSWATLSSINDYKVSIDSYDSLTANQDYQKRYLEILESLEVWKVLVFRPPVSQRWFERNIFNLINKPGERSGSVHPIQHKLTFAESPAKEDSNIS